MSVALAWMALAVAARTGAAAENWWAAPNPPDHVGIHVAKFAPELQDPYSFGSTGWNFSVRSTIRPKLVLLIDVPAGHARLNRDTGIPDGWAAGNAFLGAELGSRARGLYAQLGVRLPSAPNDRSLPLNYARLTDHQYSDRYVPEYLTLSALVNLGGGEAGEGTTRFRIEPAVLLPTEESVGTELLVRVSLATFHRVGPLWIGAGVGSVAFPTYDIEEIDDVLATEFGLTAEARAGNLRPGAFVRLPVQGDQGDSIDAVFGLGVRWLL
jgi:hypothetical protein